MSYSSYGRNVPKIASAAAGTGQQKGFDPAPRVDGRCPHVSQITVRKLNELSVEILPHPPHSSVLSPTGYHLFKHFDNFLTGKTFANQDQTKTAFVDFIESRTPNYYADGINRLALHWQKCIDSNGAYFD